MNYLKVKDANNLYRDINSNGIINDDIESYKKYSLEYKQKLNETKRIKEMEREIDNLRNDLSEIKFLLKKLCDES